MLAPHTQIQIHSDVDTYGQTQKHRDTCTHRHIDIYRDACTQTHTCMFVQIHKPRSACGKSKDIGTSNHGQVEIHCAINLTILTE